MQVHVNGRGVAGVYPWEVAETKVDTVTTLARGAGFPLRATVEALSGMPIVRRVASVMRVEGMPSE